MSLLAALMLTISSHVRVDKELSLVEKSKRGNEENTWPEIQDICTEHVRTLKNKMAETLL
jgi:hypothetical protein